MTLEGMLEYIKNPMSKVNLLSSGHPSLRTISEEPFYIQTRFNSLLTKKNSRFWLFSAPGATGKSSFGQYIAHRYKALYWDLSKIKIGDNTFLGTIHKALGAKGVSELSSNLQSGNAILVIDALDEAEMISGRESLEKFIVDVNEFLNESEYPSVFFLSRTETAQSVGSFLNERTIPFSHYEIDFFEEMQSKEFVEKAIARKSKLENGSVNSVIKECVNTYFEKIKSIINDPVALNRFIGYAPVLEAIATHVVEVPNKAKLLSDLEVSDKDVGLVKHILIRLLEREQEKVVEALKQKIEKDTNAFCEWDCCYSAEEQLARLLNYILMGTIDYSEFEIENLPVALQDDYIGILNIFLPQHPFIMKELSAEDGYTEFAGPAFRDFTLARLVLKREYSSWVDLYYSMERSVAHFPSQIFWDHYLDESKDRINSTHFPYLCEAFKAKTKSSETAYLIVERVEDNQILASFGIEDKKGITTEEHLLFVDKVDDWIAFDSLSNTSISLPTETVCLGGVKQNIRVTNSSIYCNELLVKANNVSIEAYNPKTTSICSLEPMKTWNKMQPRFETRGDGAIRLDMPNITDFPKLARYDFKFEKMSDGSMAEFIYHLGRIFSFFRTHKKDMPAKEADKIDYVVIGDNEKKKQLLGFLMSKEVIFRENHLYKINITEMSKLKISWGALASADEKQLELAFDAFTQWRNDNAK